MSKVIKVTNLQEGQLLPQFPDFRPKPGNVCLLPADGEPAGSTSPREAGPREADRWVSRTAVDQSTTICVFRLGNPKCGEENCWALTPNPQEETGGPP